ncbi:hypothetical protein ILUMI_18163 [Ignelater luminosus]|uniref:Uncharacterized protein n=1 Tax=Ignelater luminosus TaxID=2038154 RepID=A0A8K0CQS1_IGNLU|nr:hypothetical protein ILUMI_18163 [Ignelater luminosus]
MVLQTYKFASNEYRLFPIRFQVNFCEAFNKNAIGLQGVKRCGNFTGCPLSKNKAMIVCNWSPDASRFPPYIPNGRYMIEAQGLFRTTELYVARLYATVYRPIVV